jgi:pyridoxamine 5'-phosphate oxidase
MALATADASGAPDVRMVLLKGFDARGFDFYTNAESAKGEQLAANARAAICLHWKSLNWQVRARGPITLTTEAETDSYFATRDPGARRAAWASEQSREMPSRAAFDQRIAEAGARFPGDDVPRPAHWRGYRLVPLEIEFWRNRAFRMHDRLQFVRAAPGADWAKRRLYP